jgi:hypothetical protein
MSILAGAVIAALFGIAIAAHAESFARPLAAVAEAKVNPNVIRVSLTDGNDIRFTQISVEAGLSQTRVAHMVRDDLGLMWVGTQYGLNRYDGYEFEVFTPQPVIRTA